MTYLIAVLGLVVILYVSVKSLLTVRRVGFLHFFGAFSALIGAFLMATWKLFTGPVSLSRSESLDLSGTGGHYNARTGNYDNGQDPFGIYPDEDRTL